MTTTRRVCVPEGAELTASNGRICNRISHVWGFSGIVSIFITLHAADITCPHVALQYSRAPYEEEVVGRIEL